MNTLRAALGAYVAMRRGLGYKFVRQEERLGDFVRFMEKRGESTTTRALALEWATLPKDKHATWRLRLIDVRGFARHLLSVGPRTEVPPTGLLPAPSRPKPYLYAAKEIAELLEAALKLAPSGGLQRWTYHGIVGLLAVTGLRTSEALALRREDVDLTKGVLTVRATKFGKSRLVPIHATTRQALREYARRRDRHLSPQRSPYFFVGEHGGRLWRQQIQEAFRRLSRSTGLRQPGAHHGPRLHDLRHTFATETLLRWYRHGRAVELLLPVLSTYLGHACIRDTYWYLSACPELMGRAVARLERHWRRGA